MFPVKSILKRLLFFCLGYLALLLFFNIPGVRNAGTDLYSSGADVFLSTLLPQGFIHAERSQKVEAEGLGVVRVLFGNQQKVDKQMAEAKQTGQQTASLDLRDFQVRSEEFFVMPLIFFLSLLLITPVTWRKKLIGAAWGLPLLLFFTWVKLLCYTLYHFTEFPTGVYELSGLSFRLVSFVFDYLKMGANLLAATLVWVLVAFRFSDWRKILGEIGASA